MVALVALFFSVRRAGSPGTGPATHSLGTTDSQPLTFEVGGQRALPLQPTTGSADVIGGAAGNSVTAGVPGRDDRRRKHYRRHPQHCDRCVRDRRGGLGNRAPARSVKGSRRDRRDHRRVGDLDGAGGAALLVARQGHGVR